MPERSEVVGFGGVSVANSIRLALAERSEVRGRVRERSERTDAPSEARRAIFWGILLHMQEPHLISLGGVPVVIVDYLLSVVSAYC